MHCFLKRVVLSLIVNQMVMCLIFNENFSLKSEFTGQTCPFSDIIFALTEISKLSCAERCALRPECKGFVYREADKSCTGCNQIYVTANSLVPYQGALFYSPPYCGPIPTSGDSHVRLDQVGSISQVGTQVVFTCYPCTYFPPLGQDMITCQADGQWTTPKCLYGPAVGYLAKATPVPQQARGCGLIHNRTCTYEEHLNVKFGLLFNGLSGNCYCDNICCANNDCCYDTTCQ